MGERNGAKAPTTRAGKPPAKLDWNGFLALVNQAKGGHEPSMNRLREIMASGENPGWAKWLQDTFGNPGVWLKRAVSAWAGGKTDPVIAEAVEAKLDQVRRELEGANPTPIERLLAERAAHCWFIVNTYETLSVQSPGRSLAQAEFDSRRIGAAHRRFLSAVMALARVRKLATPALQINVGTNQVITQTGERKAVGPRSADYLFATCLRRDTPHFLALAGSPLDGV